MYVPMYVQWSTSTPLSDMSLGANAASVAQLSASPWRWLLAWHSASPWRCRGVATTMLRRCRGDVAASPRRCY